MASIHLCKNCGNPIDPQRASLSGQLTPCTHLDAKQTECDRAEYGAAVAAEQFPHYTLGRIRAIVETVEKPEYRMTPERAFERVREIIAGYKAVKP